MKPRDYENAWHTLKEKMLADYVSVHKEEDDIKKNKGQHYQFQVANAMVGKSELQRLLEVMDYLDKTNEFSNLLHDLERGSE
ncbi:hypothetical protein BU047_05330 [Staphylococcus simulans]|uniref:hypothetical protein n=1 Tax=Staphylococcus simulans TaxID=1286 RepID=UPI000D1DC6F5|nr:hypothetical protein [Staphylococcus simulans]PTJ02726.1 hypothetical protein BU047_05330 [Staphylococcus simulans]